MDNQSYSTYSDTELLASLRNDETQALGAIYHRYYRDVYNYLLILVKMPEVAEDLTHEVFLKIWEVRGQLEIKNTFKSYLMRMSHNKAIDMHRKIAADATLLEQLLNHYTENAQPAYLSEDELKQMDALVEDALNALTPQRRKIYEMSRKDKMSYDEIAQQLNISKNTVKVHMTQTLAFLRNFILEKGQFSLIFIILKKIL